MRDHRTDERRTADKMKETRKHVEEGMLVHGQSTVSAPGDHAPYPKTGEMTYRARNCKDCRIPYVIVLSRTRFLTPDSTRRRQNHSIKSLSVRWDDLPPYPTHSFHIPLRRVKLDSTPQPPRL